MLEVVLEKLLNKEKVDDIDLAVNLNPKKFVKYLRKKYYVIMKVALEHGTITAINK